MAGSGKTYQITVQGMRAVEPVVTREYRVIEAESAEAAKARAEDEYYRDCPDIDKNTVDVSLKGRWNTIMAIVCMAIPCLLSLVPWHAADISLRPDAVSTIVAVLLYSAFVIRLKGLQNSFNNVSDIVLLGLTVCFCASFLQLFLGDVVIKFLFFEFTLTGSQFLILAVLFSWVCMAAVAGIMWVLLFLVALTRIHSAGAAMGMAGVVYILSAFVGILLQLKQESPYFRNSLGGGILSVCARSGKHVRKDIRASADAAVNVAKTVASAAATAAVGVPVNLSTNADARE